MSMKGIAIRVENVSKQYQIGRSNTQDTLRESLTNAVSRPVQQIRSRLKGERLAAHVESFNALDDVSFEVREGEVLGLIGRNGAGKSTLLKILSRITEPTTGRVEMYGRVGSLLEVGTGFHPELTGRENIFLNGAILGMTRAEITRKFDEIVAFSEIGKFLDTPVKRYSSGMYVRLAFAVAAHLEPEILLVDEVLAVGDAQFQRKCVKKMSSVAKEGRTVLFVSHNLAMVQALCGRGILLKEGSIVTDAGMKNVVSRYLESLEADASEDLLSRKDRHGKGDVRLASVEVTTDTAGMSSVLVTGQAARFVFHLTNVSPAINCAFTIYDQIGQPVTHINSAAFSSEDRHADSGHPQFTCRVDELPLLPGRYRLNVAISCGDELEDHVEGAAYFVVEEGSIQGRALQGNRGYGHVLLRHRWILPRER